MVAWRSLAAAVMAGIIVPGELSLAALTWMQHATSPPTFSTAAMLASRVLPSQLSTQSDPATGNAQLQKLLQLTAHPTPLSPPTPLPPAPAPGKNQPQALPPLSPSTQTPPSPSPRPIFDSNSSVSAPMTSASPQFVASPPPATPRSSRSPPPPANPAPAHQSPAQPPSYGPPPITTATSLTRSPPPRSGPSPLASATAAPPPLAPAALRPMPSANPPAANGSISRAAALAAATLGPNPMLGSLALPPQPELLDLNLYHMAGGVDTTNPANASTTLQAYLLLTGPALWPFSASNESAVAGALTAALGSYAPPSVAVMGARLAQTLAAARRLLGASQSQSVIVEAALGAATIGAAAQVEAVLEVAAMDGQLLVRVALQAQGLQVEAVALLSSLSAVPASPPLQLALPLAAVIVIAVAGLLLALFVARLSLAHCRGCTGGRQSSAAAASAAEAGSQGPPPEDLTAWLRPVSSSGSSALLRSRSWEASESSGSLWREGSSPTNPSRLGGYSEPVMWHSHVAQAGQALMHKASSAASPVEADGMPERTLLSTIRTCVAPPLAVSKQEVVQQHSEPDMSL